MSLEIDDKLKNLDEDKDEDEDEEDEDEDLGILDFIVFIFSNIYIYDFMIFIS
jgi:hypothetical protein